MTTDNSKPVFKLYKKEGKLKEQPTMEKPVMIVNAPKHLERELYNSFSPKWKAYIKHINSLKEYIIDTSDWKEFEEGAEVKEFVLQHQVIKNENHLEVWIDVTASEYSEWRSMYSRIIARPKPSAKEKPAEPKQDVQPEEGDQDDLWHDVIEMVLNDDTWHNKGLPSKLQSKYHITKK